MTANVNSLEGEPRLKCMLDEEFCSRPNKRIELSRNTFNSLVCAVMQDEERSKAYYQCDETMGIIDLKI